MHLINLIVIHLYKKYGIRNYICLFSKNWPEIQVTLNIFFSINALSLTENKNNYSLILDCIYINAICKTYRLTTISFGFSLLWLFWFITFQLLKLLWLVKYHWYGSVPEMWLWSILSIKSGLKWCIHLSRSLFLYSYWYYNQSFVILLKANSRKYQGVLKLLKYYLKQVSQTRIYVFSCV